MEGHERDRPEAMPAKTKVEDLLAFLGRPRMLAVIFHVSVVADGPARFSEIHKALGGSQNTLAQRLKELVAAGLFVRRSFDEIPPRVEYEPTPKLMELEPIMKGLHEWCDRHALVTE